MVTKNEKLSTAEKYASLKQQTEDAGMLVTEKDGKLVATKKKSNVKKTSTKSR